MSQMGLTMKPIKRKYLGVQQTGVRTKEGNSYGFSASTHCWESLLLLWKVGSSMSFNLVAWG